jgi:superfamily II DNA/RNA helicase
MSHRFTTLGLPEPIPKTLAAEGITDPFPIQAKAIPPALDGRDIQGMAPTGSGKTLAFGLPMLSRVGRAEPKRPRALILVPTRELAEQIRKDLRPLADVVGRRVTAIFGGVGYKPQLQALRSGVDILVATPGRLEDLIDRRSVDLAKTDIVVLDEADRMADMGFLPAVRRILDRTATRRQTYLFSATLDGDVAVLGRDYQTDPVKVEARSVGDADIDVTHHFIQVSRADRPQQTARLIEESDRSIVFTRTRHGADRLVKQLVRANVSAVTLHGGRSQSQRTRALRAFSSGQARALVATDVAARGIHVEKVDAVIHYDLAGDHKDYVHRSGRTARAGAAGKVISLVTEGQHGAARKIQRQLRLNVATESPHVERRSATEIATMDSNHPAERRMRSTQPKVGGASGRLYVGNLPWDTTAHELEQLFADHGRVERATITTRSRDGRSRGFGFVDMPINHHQRTIGALDGSMFDGRTLRVRLAR